MTEIEISTLKTIYNHPNISDTDVIRIASSHEKVTVAKGDYLLQQGEIEQHYYCLEKGVIRSFAIAHKTGKEVTTGFFTQQEIVIEVASLFLGTPSKENLQSLTECVCWKIHFDAFNHLFRTVPGFSEWGREWMTDVMLSLKERSLSMITDSATERYLQLQSKHPEITQHVPLKLIASYLGITDTSLSRIRRRLAER